MKKRYLIPIAVLILCAGLFLWLLNADGICIGRIENQTDDQWSQLHVYMNDEITVDFPVEGEERVCLFQYETGQQHINPVCSLAGRQIICGSDLYVFFHGLDYSAMDADCRRFYEYPSSNTAVLEKYGVDYIYISDYERADFDVDMETIDETYDLVYHNPDVRIYRVNEQ